MVEIVFTYDFQPGANLQAYGEFGKKAVGDLLQAPGFVEFRGNRNVLGSPQVRITQVWQSLADWENFINSAAGMAMMDELGTYITNLHVGIWGPSPVMPEPVRPKQ